MRRNRVPQSSVLVSRGDGGAGGGGRPSDPTGRGSAAARPSAWSWPNCGPDGGGGGSSTGARIWPGIC